MAVKLKLTLYRFSISWSRVLPDSDPSNPNMEGVQYYHDLIDEILRNNLTPMATLHHFDHPRILEDQFKGFQGEEMVAKFKEYARFAFNQYAGKVKLWVTVNEPNMYCIYFPNLYNISGLYTDNDMQRYDCVRHTILAHAEAYHVFHEDNHEGRVGFTALLTPARPNSTRSEDVYTAAAYNELQAGLALNPVVHGDWPQDVKDLAGSKVPEFSEAEKQRIKGTADFLGFNVYYTLTVAYKTPDNATDGGSIRGGMHC
ncbi:putative beta-glucosidase 6 isoform X2 [Thrips palmi]|nr:putative beta-glucosidase 6 isoform X2 [Thrips palmi]